MLNVGKDCQNMSKVAKSCQKLPKVAKSCQKLPNFYLFLSVFYPFIRFIHCYLFLYVFYLCESNSIMLGLCDILPKINPLEFVVDVFLVFNKFNKFTHKTLTFSSNWFCSNFYFCHSNLNKLHSNLNRFQSDFNRFY